MEPVTHVLTGAVLARAGFNRRAAYATAAMAIGAEFPDVDTVWSWRGPVSGFQHHRGITHTFLGFPIEALAIVAGFWLWHRWRTQRRKLDPFAQPGHESESYTRSPLAPVRWLALYGCTLLALLSHLAWDWTNNYGVRPLFPFDPHWHAGSLVFIVDPLILLVLVSALVLPGLFRLIGSEVGAQVPAFPPKRWSLGASLTIAALVGLRAVEHSRAVELASQQMTNITAEQPESVGSLLPLAVLASPDLFSPFRWHAAADFGSFLQLEEVDTRRGLVSLDGDRMDKPAPSPVLQGALRSRLGRVYMDWSRMPAISISEGTGEGGSGAANTVVVFRDPRFMAAIPLLNRDGMPPLTGTVELDPKNRVVGESMDGKEQR